MHYPNLYFYIIITVHYITSTKIITCVYPNMIFLLQSANTKLALTLQYYNAHIAELENYKAERFNLNHR